MPISKSTEKSTRTGIYVVKESGLDYEHIRDAVIPKDENEEENTLVFELIGCDPSFANALRRILLSEVPTVAIENVYMWNNTSIIHDEVLAHRLGLIPIDVDARLFDPLEEGDDATDRNTLVFQLQVKCPSRRQAANTAAKKKKSSDKDDEELNALTETEKSVVENTNLDRAAFVAAKKVAIETPGRPYTLHLYSKDLIWMPQGDQESRFPNGIRPVHDDILIAKLRPGQEIELEAHARYGIGQDHAKYSPVATASYRLYTNVEIVEPIYDEDAEELAHLYEPGVFELIPAPKKSGKKVTVKVVNPYACTMSRNYMRNPTLNKSIRMTRVPNHFIFNVESVGMHKPAVLVAEAIKVLQQKCTALMELTKLQEQAFS
ncbi:insert subdomain of RNA polymerase alpha subunit [Fragilariopsis cylindrus CCMP1102]|uniref:DNA-directed RNA polymerases I and III subunit RPAC1 n=1 Tax=Fragilariopsis cylindrus CCMP1102 TaxID=635003 RepID=A0A1E7FHW8_9STRA|nr:insert subdomain of RNA polymerase alpha subunit [Fragilariopsis cylindrus CCMP1102]|eukprot:OEU17737.1 insert subdomain of RNA polymerase alpha subunit [Fragilariopsis cylindrus CCMP1102]